MEILNLHDIITAGRAFLPADLAPVKLTVTEILNASKLGDGSHWMPLSRLQDEASVGLAVLGYLKGLNYESFSHDFYGKFFLNEFGDEQNEGELTVTVFAGLLPHGEGEKSVVVIHCDYHNQVSGYHWEWLGVPANSASYLLRALPELNLLNGLRPLLS